MAKIRGQIIVDTEQELLIAALAALMRVCAEKGLNWGVIYHEAETLHTEKGENV